jgi:hypothetical protein
MEGKKKREEGYQHSHGGQGKKQTLKHSKLEKEAVSRERAF